MAYPPDEFPPELREYKCDGSHGLTYERELHHTDPDGTQVEVGVEWCADPTCAKFVRSTCHHASNSWRYVPGYEPENRPPDALDNDATSALQCDFCGKDGT